LQDKSFSVVIPTYNRCTLLRLVLDGLSRQSYQNFNVIIVIKRADDGTEEMIEKYKKGLDIRTILQQKGHVIEALSLGLREATGDFIGFLDDDAIPAPDWLQRHAETYEQNDVAGVAGDVVSAKLSGGKIVALCEEEEPPFLYPLTRVGLHLWNRPLPGAEGYFTYITRGGYVMTLGNMAYWRTHRPVRSFLGMGANMSVLRKAIDGFVFDSSCILGAGWEQMLAWYVWKKGHNMIFNPRAVVFHVAHGETLSRSLSVRRTTLHQAESELLFYRLYGKEEGVSLMYHIVSMLYSTALALKKKDIPRIKGIVTGNIIGLKRFILGSSNVEGATLLGLEAI